MNYYGRYKKPYRGACSGKVDIFPSTNLKCGCTPFQHAKQNLSSAPVQKNNTAVTGAPADATTGTSTVGAIPYPCAGGIDCVSYDGTNYGLIGSTLGGSWGNKNPQNTYGGYLTICSAVSIADGGSGYSPTDIGKTLAISGGSPVLAFDGTGTGGTVVIAAVGGGQVTAVTLQPDAGPYAASPSSPNTPTTLIPAPGGAGLKLNLTFANFYFDFGKLCYQGGTVQIVAKRFWHGNWGWINGQNTTPNQWCGSGPDVGGGLNANGDPAYKEWRPNDATPWNIKWLTLDYSYTTTEVFTSAGHQFQDTSGAYHSQGMLRTMTATVSGTITINPLSGCIYDISRTWSITDTYAFTGDTYAVDASAHPTPSSGTNGYPLYHPDPGQIVDIVTAGGGSFSSLAALQAWAGAGVDEGPSAPGYLVVGGGYVTSKMVTDPTNSAPGAFYGWLVDMQIEGGKITLPSGGGSFPNLWESFSGVFDTHYQNPNRPNAAYLANFLTDYCGALYGNYVSGGQSPYNTSYTNTATCSLSDTAFALEEWTTTSAGTNVTVDPSSPVAYTGSIGVKMTMTWSDENTEAMVDADIETNLFPLWDINNRILLPAGSRVKISRNEVQAPVQIGNGDNTGIWLGGPTTWVDGNVAVLTADTTYGDGKQPGDILGAPNPNPCPMDYFDPRFEVYQLKTGDSGPYWDITGYGGWRGLNAPRATQWLNQHEAAGLGNGEFSRYAKPLAPQDTGKDFSFWKTQWWESPVILPSQDFSRPWGLDRYLMDEGRIGGFSLGGSGSTGSFDGTNVVLIYGLKSGPPVVGEWAVFIGTSYDGIYQVATVTDNETFTVNNSSRRSLPGTLAGYWDLGQDQFSGGGLCGILRFPLWTTGGCPPFGGRLAVSGITDDGTLRHIMLATAPPLPIDWNVDLCIGTETATEIDMAAVAGGANIALNYVSATEYTTTLTAAQLAGVNYIVLYGALEGESVAGVQKWFWCDNTPKNDVVYLEFEQDARTNGEYTRLEAYIIPAGGCFTAAALNIPAAAWPPGGPYTAPNSGWAYFSDTGDCKVFAPPVVGNLILAGASQSPPPMGIKHTFSQAFALDEQYGSQAWMYYSQASEDALYQPPHTSIWLRSDGDPASSPVTAPSCVPFVESRTGYPTAGLSGFESPAAFPSPLAYPPWYSPVTNLNPTAPPQVSGDVTIQSELPTGIQEAC